MSKAVTSLPFTARGFHFLRKSFKCRSDRAAERDRKCRRCGWHFHFPVKASRNTPLGSVCRKERGKFRTFRRWRASGFLKVMKLYNVGFQSTFANEIVALRAFSYRVGQQRSCLLENVVKSQASKHAALQI